MTLGVNWRVENVLMDYFVLMECYDLEDLGGEGK